MEKDYEKKMVRHCDLRRRIIGSRMFLWYRCVKGWQDASAVKAAPVEKKKVYVSPDWVQSVLDGNQEESEDYMVLECAWGTVQDAAAYREGHIKGAYHMNTDDIESEEYWNIRTPEEIKGSDG